MGKGSRTFDTFRYIFFSDWNRIKIYKYVFSLVSYLGSSNYHFST
jgi:hypothetical protein